MLRAALKPTADTSLHEIMLNNATDLGGLLHQFWKEEWQIESMISQIEAFKKVKADYEPNLINYNSVAHYLYLLPPGGFHSFTKEFSQERVTTYVANIALPLILAFISLRRTKTDVVMVNGEPIRIGESVPPYGVVTVE